MAEAVEPFKLHPTPIIYIYKVFEHLPMLWIEYVDVHSHHYHHTCFPQSRESRLKS